ncbi:hypothetical protein SAMN05880570_2645 [Paenibacillus sp. RU4T]|uniref:hypothetical protein n=1 Tax=unclassified Paenibacillus TaxID=185978 RepID=UPI000953F3B1|nr:MULTISPECIES: hypothetical protein [unclassified Paenibacillus]SIQ89651.1 hypothetical protein SAMN05880555_2645 [Paenibacillus sp. RU4X]SIR10517.1 hypothetical protein SAMN05880570_2645 [Paenibacillus sp. RU4T]
MWGDLVIIESMIDFFIRLFASIMDMLPSMSFDTSGFTGMIASLKGLVEPAAYFLPITDISLVLGILLAYQAAGFGIWAVNWVVRRIADIIP